jgi:adenylate cyclase
MARGPVFAAEIGEPRGRREYNVLGDTVNTAARLMGKAKAGQILMTQAVHEKILNTFACKSHGPLPLKGKAVSIPIYSLRGRLDS